MSVLDKLLDAVKLNDYYDEDDYLDDEYFGIDSSFTFTPDDVREHRKFLESIYNDVSLAEQEQQG